MMVGEGGDDIIEGDAALKVAIRTPDPAGEDSTIAADGSFSFDSGNGGFATNPVTVCVSSNNGLAVAQSAQINER